MRKEFRDLASVEEASEVARELAPGSRIVSVPTEEASGRVLAETVESSIDVPGFDRSTMDGYAVRAEDTHGADEADPVVLRVVGEVATGEPPRVTVGEGEAAGISTGAPVPEGADAVVPVEETSSEGDANEEVRVHATVAPADSVMFAGSDVAAGERALVAGTRLSPREVGLAAALGEDTLRVYAKPRVAVVSTGDELVRPGKELEEGQIHDVNTFSLASAVDSAGGEAVVYEHVGDDYEKMVNVLRRAAEDCDLVLSSGSTSASDEDVVYAVVEEEGELLLHGVSLKPGRPTVLGRVDATPFVGLPGNPMSALSVFRLLVSDMIRSASGGEHDDGEKGTQKAIVADEIRTEGGRTRLLPVGLVEEPGVKEPIAYSVDKGSGATTSLTRADGYVTVDATTNYLAEGERIDVTLFESASPPSLLGAGESDAAVDRLLEGRDARWLAVGSVEGARRLRNGIVDIVAVSLSPEAVNSLGVEEAFLVRGYERCVGYVTEDSLGDADVFGVLPEGYGLRRAFEDDRDDERDDANEDVRVFRSEEGVANAVASGRVDAGFCTWGVAESNDLEFEAVGWQEVDLLVAERRGAKESVTSFLGSVEDLSLPPGYRRSDSAGEVIKRWRGG